MRMISCDVAGCTNVAPSTEYPDIPAGWRSVSEARLPKKTANAGKSAVRELEEVINSVVFPPELQVVRQLLENIAEKADRDRVAGVGMFEPTPIVVHYHVCPAHNMPEIRELNTGAQVGDVEPPTGAGPA